jgi:hypothetical protein
MLDGDHASPDQALPALFAAEKIGVFVAPQNAMRRAAFWRAVEAISEDARYPYS